MNDNLRRLVAELGKTYRDGSSSKPGHTYQPTYFNHGIPYQSDACFAEYDAMTNAVDFERKTVADLGCNVGYFCHRLAVEKRCRVFGFDADVRNLRIAEYLGTIGRIGCDFYGGDVFRRSINADIVLCLNVHHWMVKQRGFAAARDFLARIECADLFCQTAHAESGAKYRVKELPNQQSIIDMLHDADWGAVTLILDRRKRYLFHCRR